jgi:hypothetical protein
MIDNLWDKNINDLILKKYNDKIYKLYGNNYNDIIFKTPITYSPYLLEKYNNIFNFNISLDKKLLYMESFIDLINNIENFVRYNIDFNIIKNKIFISSIKNNLLKLKINDIKIIPNNLLKDDKIIVYIIIKHIWINKSSYGINFNIYNIDKI